MVMKSLIARLDGDAYKEGISGGWRFSEVILNGVTSDPIKIRPTGRTRKNGTVVLVCGSGTGKVQTTIDSEAEILADTATWIDWDKGEVTGTETDVFIGPISAIRGISISGEIKFKILM